MEKVWFERLYLNVPLNPDDSPFILQFTNRIQVTKPAGRQCNRLLNAVVKIIKYIKIKIDHAIYINVFYDGTVSYTTFSTDDILNTTNNETEFPELKIFLRNILRLKFNRDLSLSTHIYEFSSLLLISVLIRMIT